MAMRVETHPLEAAHAALLTQGLGGAGEALRILVSVFPNPASCLRLVSALLAECDEEWMSGKIYLNLNP